MDNSDISYMFKLLIIGDSGVGKSCILLRFADDYFSSSFIATIGVDYKIRVVKIDGKRVKLHIWDSAGQDRYKTITSTYYRASHGIIVVYSITNRDSFQNVRSWLAEIAKFGSDSVQKLLIGNKCDLESQRRVSAEEGADLAESAGMPFIETSAKDATNVDDAFNKMARAIMAVTAPVEQEESGLSWQPESSGSGCCK